MKFKLIKNDRWKEVEVNGEKSSYPINYMVKKIKDVFSPEKKSSIKALSAKEFAQYPFFNCSEKQTRYTDDFLVDGDNIFVTTGGDFLFTLFHSGKASYSTDVWCVKTPNNNTRFFHYYLKNNFDRNQSYFRGFKFKHLDKKGFNEMEVAIPPINEQNKISFVLLKQEQLISNIENLISKNETLFKYLSAELLSGNLRIKEQDGEDIIYKNEEWNTIETNGELKKIPKDWEKLRFDQFSSICRGGSPRPIQDFLTEDKKNGTPWIKISDATKVTKYIDSTEQYIIKDGEKRSRVVYPGDLIVSNSATPGIPRFLNITACIHDGWLLLRDFKNVDKEFLFYLIGDVREKLKSKGSGSIFTNLSIDILSSFECLIPSLKEQIFVVNILSKQEKSIERQKELLLKEKQKFEWLLDNLLTGKYLVEEI